MDVKKETTKKLDDYMKKHDSATESDLIRALDCSSAYLRECIQEAKNMDYNIVVRDNVFSIKVKVNLMPKKSREERIAELLNSKKDNPFGPIEIFKKTERK